MRLRLGTVGMVSAAMVSVLTCYTLSLRVSAERSRVEEMRGHIATQMKDIRALEAELKTRSRLPQLQRWNDNVLALSAPTAKQYAETPMQLASFAPGVVAKPAAAQAAMPVPAVVRAPAPQPAATSPLVHTASYVLPSAPVAAPVKDDDADAEPPMAKPVPAKVEKPKAKPAETADARPKAPRPVVAKAAAKADAKGLDDLFGEIDKAAAAERRSKLVKVALR